MGGSAGLRVLGEQDARIENCTFQSNHGPGLVLRTPPGKPPEGTWGTTVRDCHMYYAESHGILCLQGAKPHGVLFDGITSQYCEGSGLSIVDEGGSSVTVNNSIFQYNGGYGIRLAGCAATSIGNCYLETTARLHRRASARDEDIDTGL